MDFNVIDREPIRSPQKLRRPLTDQEIQYIRDDVESLRYEEGRDDSYLFVMAQACQLEAQKIKKQGPPRPLPRVPGKPIVP